MKFGVRKPSIKRSIKAKTTGKVKRAVKKATVPAYGKKGVGAIKNPKKAVANKVYKKTSFSIFDLFKTKKTKTSKATKKTKAVVPPIVSVKPPVKEINSQEISVSKVDGSPAIAGVKWQPSSKEAKEKLATLGVNVRQFTKHKALKDAAAIVDTLLPSSKQLNVSIDDMKPLIVFSELTKNGKPPKNVCRASMTAEEIVNEKSEYGFDYQTKGDSIICYLDYLASGDINKADLYFWHDHIRHGVKLRKKQEELLITEVVCSDLRKETEEVLYRNQDPEDNSGQIRVFDDSFCKMMSK